uniref:Transthyretin-like family protein n=1 Tax=Meloidogyne hapla TaxID=6305 RepID=A0A1I8BNI8_MELHA
MNKYLKIKFNKLVLIFLINFSSFSYIYSIKIFPQLNYKISGRLECVTYIPSNISTLSPPKVKVTPISNAQVQLWDEDARIKLPFGLTLDGDDFLGGTNSLNDGTFYLNAKGASEFFGIADLEPYLLIKHKCSGNLEKELEEEKCWLISRYDLSALPEEKYNLGIRLGAGSRLITNRIC